MKILIFAAVNALLLIVTTWFVLMPITRSISHARHDIHRQESLYQGRLYQADLYAGSPRQETLYGINLPLSPAQQPAALEAIYTAASSNSLNSRRFISNRAGSLYAPAIGPMDVYNILTENEVADVLRFFRALEGTYAHVLSANIVWDANSQANITVNMSLISQGQE